jgi:membrane-associated phospholipid phosphatase
VALWLLLLATAQGYALLSLREYFVFTETGQRLDWIALSANTIGEDRIRGLVDTVLDAVSAAALIGATLFVGFVALIRRRILLALTATALVVAANIVTQVLKNVTVRPDLGVDLERVAAGNSFPSGHTTVAASLAVALVLVLPAQVRAWGAFLGVGYAALAGVATMSAGWHRPSDAVGSLLVVGVCAAVAGALLVLFQRDDGFADEQPGHRAAVVVLLVAGVLALVGAAVALNGVLEVVETPPDDLGRSRLLAAYGGAAAGIAGTAALMMALFLGSVHLVVPRRGARSEDG